MSIDRVREALEQGRLTVNPLDDGSGVVVDMTGERLLTMNDTGMALMQAMEEGAASQAALAAALTERFEVDDARARADARVFIQSLTDTLE